MTSDEAVKQAYRLLREQGLDVVIVAMDVEHMLVTWRADSAPHARHMLTQAKLLIKTRSKRLN